MTASQSVPELIAAVQAKAKTFEDIILAGQAASSAQDLRAAQGALELAAVDAFTLFEARMQHHFKRGPFSRKLTAALKEAGRGDLAERIHIYYLAINVLKHGKGASYRELLDTPTALVHVKPTKGATTQDENAPSDLIDIGVPGFFGGLATSLLQAHAFLEHR
ncbi:MULTISPECIES: hypothetical protein [Roseobacteraceae]|uniref:hypothetical protein n=1 Tax=Roseobacteraceae TaxID=2854170 RepID=UPI00125FD318|nr:MULTISPECIES: hypothetical protein [Roseobacteraceae]KAB6715307.1 hypothetical protein C8029_16065 [Roseobacter sp. TSBP12]|tara:strand:+ start:176 stop:664 length:489 start_codon:yes stop_codon:yes gene_type:complete